VNGHPRICVNSICSIKQSLEEDLELWRSLGIDHVGLIAPKLEAAGWMEGRREIEESGLQVGMMSAYRHEMPDSLPFTAAVGCEILYTVSGGGDGLEWEDAAERFCRDMAPFIEQARDLGVRLAIEPTNPLRSDASFVHTVRDAIDLAKMAGIGVVVDFYSSWYERGLRGLLRDHIDLIELVQISDYKLGTFDTPNRCALGDGDVPVERLFTMVLDAGYEGPFDLEILGPRIEQEGYREPIVRSVARATEILEHHGA
jgi:sugar phosphate isomerase/epimerase